MTMFICEEKLKRVDYKIKKMILQKEKALQELKRLKNLRYVPFVAGNNLSKKIREEIEVIKKLERKILTLNYITTFLTNLKTVFEYMGMGKISVFLPDVYNECLNYYLSCKEILKYITDYELEDNENLELEYMTVNNFIYILRNLNFNNILVNERLSLREYESVKDFVSIKDIFMEAMEKQLSYEDFILLVKNFMSLQIEEANAFDLLALRSRNMEEEVVLNCNTLVDLYDNDTLLEVRKNLVSRLQDGDYGEKYCYYTSIQAVDKCVLERKKEFM